MGTPIGKLFLGSKVTLHANMARFKVTKLRLYTILLIIICHNNSIILYFNYFFVTYQSLS